MANKVLRATPGWYTGISTFVFKVFTAEFTLTTSSTGGLLKNTDATVISSDALLFGKCNKVWWDLLHLLHLYGEGQCPEEWPNLKQLMYRRDLRIKSKRSFAVLLWKPGHTNILWFCLQVTQVSSDDVEVETLAVCTTIGLGLYISCLDIPRREKHLEKFAASKATH